MSIKNRNKLITNTPNWTSHIKHPFRVLKEDVKIDVGLTCEAPFGLFQVLLRVLKGDVRSITEVMLLWVTKAKLLLTCPITSVFVSQEVSVLTRVRVS